MALFYPHYTTKIKLEVFDDYSQGQSPFRGSAPPSSRRSDWGSAGSASQLPRSAHASAQQCTPGGLKSNQNTATVLNDIEWYSMKFIVFFWCFFDLDANYQFMLCLFLSRRLLLQIAIKHAPLLDTEVHHTVWLVVYLPLWKILVSWDYYSQYIRRKTCSKPPTSCWLMIHCLLRGFVTKRCMVHGSREISIVGGPMWLWVKTA